MAFHLGVRFRESTQKQKIKVLEIYENVKKKTTYIFDGLGFLKDVFHVSRHHMDPFI